MSVAWVGAGIAAIGTGIAAKSSHDSKKAASEGQSQARTEFELEREKHDKWQATYGPIQDNLAEYYNSISADSYAAMGLENSQQAFDTSMKRVDESLAQRGITNSAVGASIDAQAELGHAEEKAKIRTEAPRAVAQDQMGFLQVGLGMQPSTNLAQMANQRAMQLEQQSMIQEQAAGAALQNTIGAVGKLAGDYYASSTVENSLPDYNPDGGNYSPVEQPKQPWE